MIPNKRGIELSVNFLVTLILAIVVFGMGIFLANMIFGGGERIAGEQFEKFDQQVGELACYSADNVCIHQKSATVNRGDFKTLAVTVKNVLREGKAFKLVVENTRYIDAAGDEHPGFEKLMLFGLEEGRIEDIAKGEKKTFGIGVEVPKTALSGKYTLDVNAYYADAGETNPSAIAEPYTERPFKIYIDVP